jgi:3-isopropylmalate/(R)-2-methylmalate dehydratase large subunit
MAMTIGEKIIARASGRDRVAPGDIVTATVDLCMTNDATTHISIDTYGHLARPRVFCPDRVVFIIDHNVPSDSVATAEVHRLMRGFAQDHGLHLYDGEGVCHQIMIEDFVLPGQLVLAADSHTCSYGGLGVLGIGVGSTDFVAAMSTGHIWLMVPKTLRFDLHGTFEEGICARDLILRVIGDIGAGGATYRLMEFGGPATARLSIDDRITLCNMAVEAGAKSALIEPDDLVQGFLAEQGRTGGEHFTSDRDAAYESVRTYDLSRLEPQVARPHRVDDVVPVDAIRGVNIDQAFVGSCNSGRIEQMRVAARLLEGRKVAESVRLLISPASNSVYLQALDEGLAEVFLDSRALLLNPNCSVCWGGCQGLLGQGETLISTGTRNFKGRSGHPDSKVYLASAATVVASAIAGHIVDPREFLG